MTENRPMANQGERKPARFAEDKADPAGSSRGSLRGASVSSSQLSSAMARLFLRRNDGRDSYIGSIASSRLFKFLVVGGIGVIVNLLVMALVFQTAGYRDWRASAIASTIAALHNYLLNNHWTFSDRRRSGHALFSGAFLYLPMSAAGVAITTVTYSILTQAWLRDNFGTSSLYLFGAQLVSISFGTYLNYSLNKLFTWRTEDESGKAGQELRPGKVMGPLASDDLRD
jgi:putative flippase GtrA